MTDRLARAQALLSDRGVDALLVTPGADLRYLTGYHALPLERLTCLVLPARGEATLVVPHLERPAAVAAGVALPIATWQETEDPFELVARLVGDVEVVALDDHMWAARVFALGAAIPGADQVLGGEIVAELRMRKEPSEIEALRAAGAAIDRVHRRMGEWLRAGRTEREVGEDIVRAILAEGHVTADFVIVGSGPNGASPHHELSDRVIEAGDPVVIDIGGTTPEGYCSDCTRTYVVGGEPDAEFAALYEVLQRAQAAQREHARPGVTAESVDRVGREIIAGAGYGDRFVHRTGHGIGQETHEEPYIVEGSARLLEPGMAFSIEPGIYLDGRYGARIEDIAICTDDGLEVVNTTSRDLVRLP
ncbi:aminopeptidase P family protein [Aeromicrobium sp. YIM 150415]|uniref:M24 family metallopeptidase n=1 Tax=Aeromicrobium sp. YIM 150415 TaxID=2803912 RepID=UPI001965AECF|nr:Xaa-Pro peptidase family protein [Aeromicrobium sp. YIM 150415]MBM9462516.1 aminopeptidase P family protein [Aeromicrobium sp. YIM 150415]